MIILDTNVISELMKPQCAFSVLRWMDTTSAHSMWISSVTVAEVLSGISRLPDGRRKRALANAAEIWIDKEFHQRVLSFDEDAARMFAEVVADRLRNKRHVDYPDAQIAAIARLHGATLATRNTDDFDGTGITLINPWLALA